MSYQAPTLFGLTYASRLFRQIDKALSFEELCDKTSRVLDLSLSRHGEALLEWLNSWGCRIGGERRPFPEADLRLWFL